MIIQNERELAIYRQAGQLSLRLLKQLVAAVKVGVLPLEIDDLAKKLCRQNQVQPAFLGVGNGNNLYQYATCLSVNDTAVHGLPSKTEVFKVGDLVKIDFGIIYQGFYTDFCVTVAVKNFLNESAKRLVTTAKQAVKDSIALAIPGNTTGDIGHLMQQIATTNGFDVLKKYTGHGIGRTLHDRPTIPAHGQPQTGEVLQPNMVVCLEAQVVEKGDEVAVADDGWTVKTVDGGLVAMFEYMVVVNNPPEVLTPTFDWPLVV